MSLGYDFYCLLKIPSFCWKIVADISKVRDSPVFSQATSLPGVHMQKDTHHCFPQQPHPSRTKDPVSLLPFDDASTSNDDLLCLRHPQVQTPGMPHEVRLSQILPGSQQNAVEPDLGGDELAARLHHVLDFGRECNYNNNKDDQQHVIALLERVYAAVMYSKSNVRGDSRSTSRTQAGEISARCSGIPRCIEIRRQREPDVLE
ncbi:uncharacterized protein PADG_08555 [Paracoccidioides brasiliensis Pb18]|uniref:Uncharacterized protein n=1 Tax=Paracoccidioides brasiliensis (strain Pb18) TaxID=502780 RepID=C1GMR1_PARBD|nr:uncharacterized protein PADG_08555 [Paracoccidioides brasiliensis Pb18]EEH44913.2 hypothetical protein PADG_08555 [Paracoccidioides brasiliensis Pb18]ODH45544.1 hypothetical protein GX48_08380 [Paracoccidioides brasiliensis]